MRMICSAQAPAELHPGQTATISIVFDGVDASKLTNVIAYFNNPNIPTDQAGFTSELDFGDAKLDGPGAFKLSLKIPDSAASGTYKLIQIRAIGEKGAIPITIQCTYRPLIASGSSTTSAAPNGADHARGGDTSAPLQV